VFEFAGVTNALASTVAVFGLNVACTIAFVAAVDRVGRRTLLLLGNAVMIVALAALGVTLLAMDAGRAQGALAVVCVLVYVAGFAVSFGGVCFVILGEVVPTAIRPKAYALATGVNWVGNLALSLGVLSLIEALGGGGDSDAARKRGVAVLYLLFGGVMCVAWVFNARLVPETKGQSLEALQRYFEDAHAARARAASATGAEPLLSGGGGGGGGSGGGGEGAGAAGAGLGDGDGGEEAGGGQRPSVTKRVVGDSGGVERDHGEGALV
jgi:uncharacterized membrane protein YgcG